LFAVRKGLMLQNCGGKFDLCNGVIVSECWDKLSLSFLECCDKIV